VFRRRTTTQTPAEERSLYSIADPAFAAVLNVGMPNYSGVTVGEHTALTISAVWRATSLISGTIASLPARTVTHQADGTRAVVPSWADSPGDVYGATSFEFWEQIMVHLLLHGNAFCLQIRNGAGAPVGLFPLHPTAVSVERVRGSLMKVYRVTTLDGSVQEYTDLDLLHIPALSTDGLRGLGPLQVARNSLGVAVAGDRAAARMFSSGALFSGLVTPEEDVTEEEAQAIKAALDAKLSGWDHAGELALVNRKLKFTPWTMSHVDAQFLESRQFQIEEIARWFGVPPYELMQTEKQTSWGTGIEAQQRGLARQVIGPWVKRLEERVSRLFPTGRYLEFEFAGLERPTPEQEIDLLIRQVQAGLLTVNEARAIRNMPPIEGGDGAATPSTHPSPPSSDREADQ
jgi:HK97 family phage portal protein